MTKVLNPLPNAGAASTPSANAQAAARARIGAAAASNSRTKLTAERRKDGTVIAAGIKFAAPLGSSANSGIASVLPAAPAGYTTINILSTDYKVPVDNT
jgi:hypothetical protein